MTFQLARHGAGPVGGRGRGGLGSRTRGRVLKRQAIMRNLLRSRSCGEPPRASQAGGERASVRDVLRALTGAYRGKASRGKRSTATRGVPHDESGDGEETHREWLARLSLRPDPFGQHRPPGLREGFSIGGNYPAGLSRIRRIGNRPILERQAELTVKVSGRRVDARNHDTGGRSGDRRRRRTCQD